MIDSPRFALSISTASLSGVVVSDITFRKNAPGLYVELRSVTGDFANGDAIAGGSGRCAPLSPLGVCIVDVDGALGTAL